MIYKNLCISTICANKRKIAGNVKFLSHLHIIKLYKNGIFWSVKVT